MTPGWSIEQTLILLIALALVALILVPGGLLSAGCNGGSDDVRPPNPLGTPAVGRGGPFGLATLAVLAVVALAVIVPATQGSASTPAVTVNGWRPTDPAAGCGHRVPSLPATDSQVTVSGHGQYSGLAVTVNQTADLTNQAVSVTWTGGTPTFSDPTSKAFDFDLQRGLPPDLPVLGRSPEADPTGAGAGPLPSHCEFGGEKQQPVGVLPDQGCRLRILPGPERERLGQLPVVVDRPGHKLPSTPPTTS